MQTSLAVRVVPSGLIANLVASLRVATGSSISFLASALKAGDPIPICSLFGRGHSESEQVILTLLDELARQGTQFEILLDGQIESITYLHNRLQSWKEIAYQIQIQTDRELGESSEQAGI